MSKLGDLLSKNISADPKDVKTHFTVVQVSKPSRGQTRYQCLRCNHEFECCGLGRLIQHVTGVRPLQSKTRDVRPCTNPYHPLRLNLLEVEAARGRESTAYRSILDKRKYTPSADETFVYENGNVQEEKNRTESYLSHSQHPPLPAPFPPPLAPLDPSPAPLNSAAVPQGELESLTKHRLLCLVITLCQLAPELVQLAYALEKQRDEASRPLPTTLPPLVSLKVPREANSARSLLYPLEGFPPVRPSLNSSSNFHPQLALNPMFQLNPLPSNPQSQHPNNLSPQNLEQLVSFLAQSLRKDR